MSLKWTPKGALPGGHRLFSKRGLDSWFVFIADESGIDPDLTDDGPLYINRDEPIDVGPDGCTMAVSSIEKGQSYKTTVSLADALWLSDRYRMELRTTGASTYRAIRTAT